MEKEYELIATFEGWKDPKKIVIEGNWVSVLFSINGYFDDYSAIDLTVLVNRLSENKTPFSLGVLYNRRSGRFIKVRLLSCFDVESDSLSLFLSKSLKMRVVIESKM